MPHDGLLRWTQDSMQAMRNVRAVGEGGVLFPFLNGSARTRHSAASTKVGPLMEIIFWRISSVARTFLCRAIGMRRVSQKYMNSTNFRTTARVMNER